MRCICFSRGRIGIKNAEEFVLLGAALALQIAEGLSRTELDAAAALYTVIGDQLALIAVTRNETAEKESALT